MREASWNGGGVACPRSTLPAQPGPQRAPRRIQRSRRRSFVMPAGAIYVGRPTLWGNPFDGRQWGHAKATILHERWLTGRLGALSLERMGFDPGEIDALDRRRCTLLNRLHQLAGHDLACWCPLNSRWCHANFLLRAAPAYADYERFAA